jgi:hypothetical protein
MMVDKITSPLDFVATDFPGGRTPAISATRVHAMNENNASFLTAVAQEQRGGPLSRTFLAARVVAIGAALAGAVPTAMNLYHSWKHNIPFTEVSQRLAQAELWSRNYDCKIDYRALTTTNGTRIDVGACSKNGDISLKISTTGGQSTYEWIAFDKLNKPAAKRTASLFDLVIATAHADDGKPAAPTASGAPSATAPVRIQTAQAMQVVCTAKVAATQIVRIVNEGGKCYRETFSPVAGKVEKREDVPCNTQCPVTKG